MRTIRYGCIALAVCLVAQATGQPTASAAKSSREQEEELIRRGVDLRKAGDDQTAWPEFKKAYELTRSPRAAAQLGLVEQALGRWEDAEVHVSEALRAAADPWVAKNRQALEQALGVIKSNVARVEVVGEPRDAEVLINGTVVGRLPLAGPVRVSAGVVDIELRAPGHLRSTRSITVSGGQYQRLAMRLEREPAVGAGTSAVPGVGGGTSSGVATGSAVFASPHLGSNPSSTAGDPSATGPGAGSSEPASSDRSIRSILKWSAVGLAAAGLATGITASYLWVSRVGEFEDAGCKLSPAGTGWNWQGMPTQDCQDRLDAYKSMRPWQIAGFVGAGVFATTALILFLTDTGDHPDRSSTTARWACTPSLTTPGASCAMRF